MFPPPNHCRRAPSTSALVLLLACALILAGCQAEKPQAARANPTAPDVALQPCAGSLHDLSGYLLQYYVVNGQLAKSLEDLRPLVDVDRQLPLACPATGRPYVYIPQGLRSSTDQRWLLLHDAEPHDGIRNAILGAEPVGNQPLALWVVQLDSAAFMAYHLLPPVD